MHYLFCVLDDSHSYRLIGYRGECAYLGMTFGTAFGQGQVGGRTGTQTQTHIDEFELGPNGEVDILIAPASTMPDPRPRNSVVLEPGTAQLAIRETHFDKRPEQLVAPADGAGARAGRGGAATHPLDARSWRPSSSSPPCSSPSSAAPRCRCGTTPRTNMNTFGGQAGSAHVAAQEDEVRTHTNAEMTYHGGRFRLEPGEALVVTVHEPDKPFLYWGLTLTSPWMESFDYRYTTTGLNNKTATRSADGSWRMVIAPSRPGSRRGELARHRGPARGLHAGALGAGRRPAAPDRRGGEGGGPRRFAAARC